jgi:putative transposase
MITARKDGLSIAKSCELLGISEAGFHKERKEISESKIPPVIHIIKEEFFFYGYRRVTKELHRRGHIVNHKKVLKLMKKEGLIVVKKKFTPKTTQSNHNLERYANLLLDFIPTGINQAWVTDITYIPILNKFAYLALVMDLFSRKIVGWNLTWNPDSHLTLSALNKAVLSRGIRKVNGCIHHSDHGVQYLCNDYTERLKGLGMKPSMGEVGNSYDNAHAESLNKTIKYEAVYPSDFESFEEAYETIAKHIILYNKKRLHSKIGYLPPNEFEQKRGIK